MLGVAEPGKSKKLVVWDTEEISVGRSPENDLLLEDSDASRRHALLVRKYSGFEVQDLGTANGTTVNGERLTEARMLETKDIIKIGEVELTFIQSRKDPSGTGLPVEYASQLKDFAGGPMANADPESTTLGLADPVAGAFDVASVGDFEVDPGNQMPPVPRDLDAELGGFGPGAPVAEDPTRASLHIEIEGLSGDLRQTIESLLGKVIELPSLRIRIKEDDL
jgi:predicted component of type VI protein secretion system